MKLVINIISLSLAISSVSFAGGSGGGGGPRPTMDVFKVPVVTDANLTGDISGGGAGPRPTINGIKIPVPVNQEAVKTIELKNGQVKFQYKAPKTTTISLEKYLTTDIDQAILDTLIKSLDENKWIEISE